MLNTLNASSNNASKNFNELGTSFSVSFTSDKFSAITLLEFNQIKKIWERYFFYCDMKSCSYQSYVVIFGCISNTQKYCLLVSFQSNWCCLLTCCWLILIFLECRLCPVLKRSCLTMLIKVCFMDILNTLSVVQDTV